MADTLREVAQTLTSVLALWLGARFGVNEKSIGIYFVYYGLLSFFMRSLFLGPVVDRIGEVGALRLGTLLLAFGMLLYPLVPTVWLMIPLRRREGSAPSGSRDGDRPGS